MRFKIPRVKVESEHGVHSLVLEKHTLWVLPENAVAVSASELLNTCLQVAYLAGAKDALEELRRKESRPILATAG